VESGDWLARHGDGRIVVRQSLQPRRRPDAYARARLAPGGAKLAELGAADDTELVSAAQAVSALLNNTGKCNVTAYDSKGVQLGDHDIQVNRDT
jgi:hypothetical protein